VLLTYLLTDTFLPLTTW